MGIFQGGKGAGGKLRPEKENINTHVWGSRMLLSMWEKKEIFMWKIKQGIVVVPTRKPESCCVSTEVLRNSRRHKSFVGIGCLFTLMDSWSWLGVIGSSDFADPFYNWVELGFSFYFLGSSLNYLINLMAMLILLMK
jgi:hypothetical protein